MKKLFLVVLMMLACSAWAEWVMYFESDIATHYFDPATIRKDGHIRRVWLITDLRKRHKDGEMSRRLRSEYDCRQERMRILVISEHSEPMAGGVILRTEGEDKIGVDVAPDTTVEAMFKIVCAK